MGKVAVFDSGLGSLSIIQAIQKITKAEIIYFADQKHYPYGKKTPIELRKIIENTIRLLNNRFHPDIIIVGSNTPTLLFPDLFDKSKTVIGVYPPLDIAQKKSKTKSIAILGTTATITSKLTKQFIKNNLQNDIQISKIDASVLINLVESGKFISDEQYCQIIIKKTVEKIFVKQNIDVVTLSSTHLPFLLPLLQKIFPHITFLDPAMQVATRLTKNKSFTASTRNSLKIFSSSDPKILELYLQKLKIKKKIQHLSL